MEGFEEGELDWLSCWTCVVTKDCVSSGRFLWMVRFDCDHTSRNKFCCISVEPDLRSRSNSSQASREKKWNSNEWCSKSPMYCVSPGLLCIFITIWQCDIIPLLCSVRSSVTWLEKHHKPLILGMETHQHSKVKTTVPEIQLALHV